MRGDGSRESGSPEPSTAVKLATRAERSLDSGSLRIVHRRLTYREKNVPVALIEVTGLRRGRNP